MKSSGNSNKKLAYITLPHSRVAAHIPHGENGKLIVLSHSPVWLADALKTLLSSLQGKSLVNSNSKSKHIKRKKASAITRIMFLRSVAFKARKIGITDRVITRLRQNINTCRP